MSDFKSIVRERTSPPKLTPDIYIANTKCCSIDACVPCITTAKPDKVISEETGRGLLR